MVVPKVGNQQLTVIGIAFDFEREHLRYHRGESAVYTIKATMKLQGIFPPITTPFDHKGDIYITKVQHNVEKWNRTSLSGYVVMGSTGESVLLTTEEKYLLWELVAKHAAPDKLLIAGT